MPVFPQHINCRCRLEKIAKPIPNVTAKPYADIRKFKEHGFSENDNKGKKVLFETWGYTVEDSEYLKELFLSQAIEKYCNGEYEYKAVLAKIKKGDYRICDAKRDREAGKAYRDLFRK